MLQREFLFLFYEPSFLELPQGMCILGVQMDERVGQTRSINGTVWHALAMFTELPQGLGSRPSLLLIRWADRVSVRVNGLETVVPFDGLVVSTN